jgi:hypothetical protein
MIDLDQSQEIVYGHGPDAAGDLTRLDHKSGLLAENMVKNNKGTVCSFEDILWRLFLSRLCLIFRFHGIAFCPLY